MDDLAQLRKQLEEERQRRQRAEARASEEQRRREEEERRREEEQRRREEEQRRREEEQRRREEEQRRREAAEASLTLTDLRAYIWNCHDLSLAINIVTDPTETTQGGTAKATRRYYPSRIIPWEGFLEQQSSIWNVFHQHPSFMSMRQFPSSHQLDYVLKTTKPITAEMDLRYYERDTVENHVQLVVDEVYKNDSLRRELRLAGSVTFESHINLGVSKQGPSLEDQMEKLSIEPNPSAGKSRPCRQDEENTPLIGQADRFCVYRRGDDGDVPAIAIEYKAPHKLTCDEIMTGLSGEIQPARDVIDKEENTTEFYSRRLVTVVITQLFSYMVGKGVRNGYVCTGEVFIFLHIPEDPSIVQYALCVPNQDVREGYEEDFECTAVARVIAFTLLALAAPSPSQEWHDAVTKLGVWPVEYAEVLEQTPSPKRLKKRNVLSPIYRGRKGKLPPFHMKLRSCRPTENQPTDRSPSPPPPDSPSPALRARGRGSQDQPTQTSIRGQDQHRGRSGRGGRGGARTKTGTVMGIRDRPYCSQKCLLGLRDGGRLDRSCPNFQDHCGKPIPSRNFSSLIQKQLAIDRGDDADCCPLYKSGSYGALFKVRLSSHGFTLVAKGARYENHAALLHEQQVYYKLQTIQGRHVPVCLGAIALHPKYPYYYDGGRYTHMLLLSWAGGSLTKNLKVDSSISSMIQHSLQVIHSHGVLHGDAEPRNILWNNVCRHPMIVDFGRASIKEPLTSISPNTRGKKKPGNSKTENSFMLELQTMKCSLDALASSTI
ncbi:hypothetical protein D8B26_002124 [Coccidioides posadasii str. Silveira]|uniref:Uncharacterized protein n=1 Tax=Coccidioides posadasii (strain RMSCC 757 / Silveira) TaxID=443226 RepID=E9CUX8_COCPS|nr:conserved hypothetical protein [Coccidioides posadasii str. Silveira]QVM07426.1 hypothetical protein D8B26_002124 [Coccidioides posadasii str. Silveira]